MTLTAPSTNTSPSQKRSRIHVTGPNASPQHTTSTPLDVTAIDNHKKLLHNTIYHVRKWKEDTLTAKQLSRHVENGLVPNKFDRTNPEDEDTRILSIPFNTDWKPAWMEEPLVITTPNGKSAIDTYHKNKAPTRKKVRTAPPAPKQQPRGWHPEHTTFTTSPINPDLDAIPTTT